MSEEPNDEKMEALRFMSLGAGDVREVIRPLRYPTDDGRVVEMDGYYTVFNPYIAATAKVGLQNALSVRPLWDADKFGPKQAGAASDRIPTEVAYGDALRILVRHKGIIGGRWPMVKAGHKGPLTLESVVPTELPKEPHQLETLMERAPALLLLCVLMDAHAIYVQGELEATKEASFTSGTTLPEATTEG